MKTSMYDQIRLIRDGNDNIFFDGANGDLYLVDEETSKVIQLYMDKNHYFNNNEERFINVIKDKKFLAKDIDISEIKLIFENREIVSENLNAIYKHLNKIDKYSSLSINVSEKCNFNCIYCFGDGGSYGRKETMMNWEIANKLIDHWIDNINPNSNKYYVNFFGGEPF